MIWKSTFARPFAQGIAFHIRHWSAAPIAAQASVFKQLMRGVAQTAFGKDHGLTAQTSYKEFRKQVPLRDYEDLRPYIDRIIKGEKDVLWPGAPAYFAKTSGTTSGVKYIPLTKESMPNHFGTARNALFNYYANTGKGDWMDGKIIFLSGSPELSSTGDILTGRLSGIVNHQVPAWLRTNQLPTYATNSIEDWETKLEHIVDETIDADMRLISGIPPWVQMYYERLLERTGKQYVKDIFPNYSVFVYGGVNYEPYRASMEKLVGKQIDTVETYPASEGFIAFQDSQVEKGLLLNVNSGIFFEFVPADQFYQDNPPRLSLEEVEIGVNYAIIINNNAGLWGYNIGDTVEFVSTSPYRIIVTGRIKHFISAFGEHVIGKEVDTAMLEIATKHNIRVVEFTVAPNINPQEGGLPYHEWWVEFEEEPSNLEIFAEELDKNMAEQNIYYRDLIDGKILKSLVIRSISRGSFITYMKTQGKLGGQNKVPRLSNDRKIADQLRSVQKD